MFAVAVARPACWPFPWIKKIWSDDRNLAVFGHARSLPEGTSAHVALYTSIELHADKTPYHGWRKKAWKTTKQLVTTRSGDVADVNTVLVHERWKLQFFFEIRLGFFSVHK